ncbi:hypothetical protein H6G54_15070 [Anabaena cylindrica FACHB-243]|nr:MULTISPECIES: hypothetical protein [Anabaena]MBD2418995.1 hypothetical protein [Anabaena cylindrica FACHB-243]MBY5282940.1 hypothetical protein [Anabaena sp. CCAP 1446/1C]MBY5309953.1 hypothetical protein [Anabaena sp. CCAP 1446/1C]MCM2407237.1 hypothetical protein [Anabaena sp. CCAP 1446/1C]BAY02426.1 hypothetical protein NIES19_16700 [Anabaena cylindrica PCC 7122]
MAIMLFTQVASYRESDRILKVAPTIADLPGDDDVRLQYIT